MDTFRKWLNKPKADDKSLLARFYHADRSLTAVASELDSFDGRAQPDRCSRLVSRLRQGQDKVLAITNLIMEELLGEDRDARAFRAKFPEEVLQENLAGQLWFGAECLAAGSSIMNREQESKEMRPLAQAVTKSLGTVRTLLRDQCLRNNVPNSKTLHLDVNDSTTEQLYESLKIFDRLFAEFELRYVSAMVQVKTKHEYEMQELICVLFSETVQRALTLGLLDQDKVDAFDPELMFSIPRLAIISGLVIYPDGPLNMDMSADKMSEMFRPFRTILRKIRDLLMALSRSELLQLEKLLCTNEDLHINIPLGASSIEAPSQDLDNNNRSTTNCDIIDNNNSNNTNETGAAPAAQPQETPIRPTSSSTEQRITASTSAATPGRSSRKVLKSASKSSSTRYAARSPSTLSVSADTTPNSTPAASPTPTHSIASTSSVASSTSTHSPAEWSDDDYNEDDDDDGAVADEDDDDDDEERDDDEDEGRLPKELDMVSNDCATGYLMLNTNFGNLLQPQEVALNGNFIASEDEFAAPNDNQYYDDMPTTSAAITAAAQRLRLSAGAASSDDSELPTTMTSCASPTDDCDNSVAAANGNVESNASACPAGSNTCSKHPHRHHHHHHGHGHGHGHSHSHHHHHHHHHHRHHHHHHSRNRHPSKAHRYSLGNAGVHDEHSSTDVPSGGSSLPLPAAVGKTNADTSSVDSRPSSLSDGDATNEVAMALRRIRFKNTENLLHRLFVCISGVADQLQTNFASDLRQILRSVFLMNMSPSPDEEDLNIPEKKNDSELFEFRASENDVIQESAGSNQSIYSAEEVNPELDNVFHGNNGNRSSGSNSSSSHHHHHNRHSTGSGIQRVNTIDLGASADGVPARNQVSRSRSLGDQQDPSQRGEVVAATTSAINRRPSSIYSGSGSGGVVIGRPPSNQRNRHNSVGSNSPSSSASSSCSETNSPVSDRAAAGFGRHHNNHNFSHNYRHNNNNNAMDTATTNTTTNSSASTQLSTTTPTPTTPPSSPTTTTTPAGAMSLSSPTGVTTNARISPPVWVPDEKAPRCMSCRTPFTAFRRRHHCRNCGGVFCGVCSNASAPLPKYGLTKAVRVCRECYVTEVANAMQTSAGARTLRSAAATAGAS